MLTLLEKVNLLQKASVFQGVHTESLARVAAVAQEVSWDAQQLLFRANDAADTLFVLLDGEVALLRDGKETRRLGPNEAVGVLAVLAGDSHTESAKATGAVRALRIDQQDFYDVMAEDFNVTRGVLKALVRLAAGGG